MGETFLVAFSIALLLTAAFTFRFRMWSNPRAVAAYFATFLTLEWVAEQVFLKPGTLGIEIAYLCLPLVGVFVLASLAARRIERTASADAKVGDAP